MLTHNSCTDSEIREKKDSYTFIIDSLNRELDEKKTTIQLISSSLHDIENNLDSISGHQKLLCLKTDNVESIKKSHIDEINKDIKAINRIVKNNRSEIIHLNRKYKNEMFINDSLKIILSQLKQNLAKKEFELKSIKAKLILYESRITNLETILGQLAFDNNLILSETPIGQTNLLRMAFYTAKKRNELLKDGIIDKNENFLIKPNSERNSNFDNEKFVEIDITETTNIPLNCKEINILTTHPSNSYLLDKRHGLIRSLIITNPVSFWQISKYLVIIKV